MYWENDEIDSCGGYQCSRQRNKYKLTSDYCDFDKENTEMFDGKNDNELCLYDTSPPTSSEAMNCNLFDDHDPNSLDSGYDATNGDSPKTSLLDSFNENVLLDISQLTNNDENTQLQDFNKLLCNPIKNYDNPITVSKNISKPKRSLSMVQNTSRVRSCLFKIGEENMNQKTFKRTILSPENDSPKRLRVLGRVENILPLKQNFSRSLSVSEDTIKKALQRESTENDLIGDFSREFCLPLVSGRHHDLKSITPTTLALLLRGHFNNMGSFKLIDCRYPYEYEGGHIIGAVNLFTKQQILDELLTSKIKEEISYNKLQDTKRHILVFHCEFSSERGPNLSRFLRNIDRLQNENVYPYLNYPEIYLLDGGYKNFYEQYSELCAPDGYLPMLHPEHSSNLKLFRSKSKTFNCDFHMKSGSRNSGF